MSSLLERFLRYVAYDTRSDEAAGTTPSTPGQMRLAERLVEELRALGLADAGVDGHAYVTATLPGRGAAAGAPVVGLIAHLDTATEFPGVGARPRVVSSYDGGRIELGHGLWLDPEVFPVLREKIGRTLVVTDGSTLLGADDKAGIAVIMTALAEVAADPGLAHPPLRIAFTPDEEIGHGAALLDVARFGADFAYTMDGGKLGEIEFENFNAVKVEVAIRGRSIHPGQAKGRMVNAVLVGIAFVNGLPAADRPETTEGREGFFHVTDFRGDVASTHIRLIVRDHDAASFEARTASLRRLAEAVNARWPGDDGTPRVTLAMTEQYRNMVEKVRPHMHIVETAMNAMRAAGVEPIVIPIRGGTDGAQLSWRGLPAPNLFCGQYNIHGPHEFAVVEDMRAAVDTLLGVFAAYAGPPAARRTAPN